MSDKMCIFSTKSVLESQIFIHLFILFGDRRSLISRILFVLIKDLLIMTLLASKIQLNKLMKFQNRFQRTGIIQPPFWETPLHLSLTDNSVSGGMQLSKRRGADDNANDGANHSMPVSQSLSS